MRRKATSRVVRRGSITRRPFDAILCLNDRLRGSRAADRVRVAMHDPPATVLESKNRRAAQREGGALFGSTNLRFESLEFVNARELRREVLRECVEAEGSTVAVVRRCTGHRVADLREAALRRPKRVCKSDIVALREQRLQRGWISAEEVVDGAMRLLDERGEILWLFHVLNLAHQDMSPADFLPHDDMPGRIAQARSVSSFARLAVTSAKGGCAFC